MKPMPQPDKRLLPRHVAPVAVACAVPTLVAVCAQAQDATAAWTVILVLLAMAAGATLGCMLQMRGVVDPLRARSAASSRMSRAAKALARFRGAALCGLADHLEQSVLYVDPQRRVRHLNAAAVRLTGVLADLPTAQRTYAHRPRRSLDGSPLGQGDLPLMRALRGETVLSEQSYVQAAFGRWRQVSVTAIPVHGAWQQVRRAIGVVDDITDRKTAEALERGQSTVMEMMLADLPLKEVLQAIVQMTHALLPEARACTILQAEGSRLRTAAASGMPEAVSAQIDGLKIAEGSGVCGTAAARRQTVVAENVQTDPLLADYQQAMGLMGAKACWSVPVIGSEGDVLATFAVYPSQPYRPDVREKELVSIAAHLVRIAFEHTRALRAWRESEARFRELAENIQEVFYSRDATAGRILYISPACRYIFGLAPDDVCALQNGLLDLVHPEDRARVAESVRHQSDGAITDLEYRLLRPDGGICWVRDLACPVFERPGEPVARVVGSVRDITRRKEADEQLARTTRALQMLSRSSAVVVQAVDEHQLLHQFCRIAVDLDGCRTVWIAYARDNARRDLVPVARVSKDAELPPPVMLSWSADDPLGRCPPGRAVRTGQPVVCAKLDETEDAVCREAVEALGCSGMVCLPLRGPQRVLGVLILCDHWSAPPQDEELALLQELADNLAFGIGTVQARQEHRAVEADMLRAHTRLQEQASLLDKAQDAIIVRDLARRVTYWNKSAERLYGWTAQEAVGASVDALIYADTAKFQRAMQTLWSVGEWTGEILQVTKDGRTITAEGRWTLVRDAAGIPVSVLTINTDISERKRAREEIVRLNASLEERVRQRTRELEEANRELEAFSYSVSHDLRSPLSAIDGFSRMLEQDLGPQAADGQAQHYLRRIRAGVGQMGQLIDDMLSLAQVSRSSMHRKRVDLAAMAQQVIDSLQERDPARSVEVAIQPGLQLWGDPGLMMRVVENLIGNAWKFTARQPAARIEVGRMDGEGGEPVYFVRDNGAGFDMAYAQKLFGTFQRLHSVSEFPGTGIGLATVHRIVTRHGGKVWAQAAPQQGAAFYFTVDGTHPESAAILANG